MTGCLMIVASLLVASADSACSSDAIRPQSDRLRQLVDFAISGSPTVRAVVTALSDRHAIVYVVAGTCDSGRLEACLLHWVANTAGYRFLRVAMRDDVPPVRGAAVLAHELQHALEVAEAGVVDVSGFEALYRRIGRRCAQQHVVACYETDGATTVQARVIQELTPSAAASQAAVRPDAAGSRVRALDRESRRLLSAALACSPTVAAMVSDLEATDLIVGIATHPFETRTYGELRVLAASAEARHIRIRITVPNGWTELIRVLGHELRHALEVAAAPEVRDRATQVSYYSRVGYAALDGGYYETAAAIETGRQVVAEIAGCRQPG